ncbi:hypothetical protein [Microvirga splendida]|uniref:Uncharacterized protein n=1 Tax=Microvirga splendida TaxID=2795727 RepID=A0ABS0Y5Z8_9HYPH|nr:hypothetical protein [Microvirga splendida]MBJ6127737.1 hypothetical protein [Microvirga splendida]
MFDELAQADNIERPELFVGRRDVIPEHAQIAVVAGGKEECQAQRLRPKGLNARITVHQVLKGTMPFFVPLLLALTAISIFPGLSTFLPNLLFN